MHALTMRVFGKVTFLLDLLRPACILAGVMEVFKTEAREVLNRFLHHRLSFPNCIVALDAALAGLVPQLTTEQIPPLRAIMLANNATVMEEMERRWVGRRN